jgi:hypothetical protein
VVIVADALEDGVEAVERLDPVLEIGAWPGPLLDTGQDVGELVLRGSLDTSDELVDGRVLLFCVSEDLSRPQRDAHP